MKICHSVPIFSILLNQNILSKHEKCDQQHQLYDSIERRACWDDDYCMHSIKSKVNQSISTQYLFVYVQVPMYRMYTHSQFTKQNQLNHRGDTTKEREREKEGKSWYLQSAVELMSWEEIMCLARRLVINVIGWWYFLLFTVCVVRSLSLSLLKIISPLILQIILY